MNEEKLEVEISTNARLAKRHKHREYMRKWRGTPKGKKITLAANKKSNRKSLSTAEGREKNKLGCKEWAKNHLAKYMLKVARQNSKTRGHECTLTLADISAMIKPMKCSITRIDLQWHGQVKGGNPYAPSLDRIDNSIGYHIGNVRVVCWAFNKMRGTFSDDVVYLIARSLVTHQNLLEVRKEEEKNSK